MKSSLNKPVRFAALVSIAALAGAAACGQEENVSGTTAVSSSGAALTSQEVTTMLATMAVDLDTTTFTCPTVTKSVANGVTSVTFDFGTGCTPNPAVLLTSPISGSATVSYSGAPPTTLSLSFATLSYNGYSLSGSATIGVSGTTGNRTWSVNGTYSVTYLGVTYTLQFNNFQATTTLSGTSATMTTSGTVVVTDGTGTLTLTATNLSVSSSSVSGSIAITASQGYLSANIVASFATTGALGVKVTVTINGVAVVSTTISL